MPEDKELTTLPSEQATPLIAGVTGLEEMERVAERSERYVEAYKKIKEAALKMTNKQDWVDMQGRPYLQETGADKIADMAGVSWKFLKNPQTNLVAWEKNDLSDGHYIYSCVALFTFRGREIEMIGSRSSKDQFFTTRYQDGKQVELPPEDVGEEDVQKAAKSNCIVLGLTTILGLRNLTWEEVERYTGFKRDQCGKVAFRQTSKPPDKQNPPTQPKPAPPKTPPPSKPAAQAEPPGTPPPTSSALADFKAKMDECADLPQLFDAWNEMSPLLSTMPEHERTEARKYFGDRQEAVRG